MQPVIAENKTVGFTLAMPNLKKYVGTMILAYFQSNTPNLSDYQLEQEKESYMRIFKNKYNMKSTKVVYINKLLMFRFELDECSEKELQEMVKNLYFDCRRSLMHSSYVYSPS